MTGRIALIILWVSLAWTTVPRLYLMTAEAVRLLPLSLEQRRARVVGPFYEAMATLRSGLAGDHSVALLLRKSDDIGAALFFNFYNYPLKSKIYQTSADYLDDEDRPPIIIGVDGERPAVIRRITEDEFWAHQVGDEFVVKNLEPGSEQHRRGIVPLVASAGARPPDLYFLTEVVVENAAARPARVRFEILPHRRTAEVVLQASERKTWNDFVETLFDVNGSGWLRFEADQPIRVRFWVVNRGRGLADAMPFVEPVLRASFNAPPGSKLWVVNTNDEAIDVTLNGEPIILGPLDYTMRGAEGRLELHSNSPFVAYVSWRDAAGRSLFAWPAEGD